MMGFGNLIEVELMTNSWMFEDVEACKRINKKYDKVSLRTAKVS